MAKLKYVDHRPIWIPTLEKYKNGITPKTGQVLEVNEKEKRKLLTRKNGNAPCFEEVKETSFRPKKEETKIEDKDK